MSSVAAYHSVPIFRQKEVIEEWLATAPEEDEFTDEVKEKYDGTKLSDPATFAKIFRPKLQQNICRLVRGNSFAAVFELSYRRKERHVRRQRLSQHVLEEE